MKKALLVTTVSGFVPQFEMNSVALLQENGYEVHYATNYNMPFYGTDNSRLEGTEIIQHQIDFSRSPYSKQTLIAYKQLVKLMKDIEFDVIHCHTPMGGFLARLAAKKNKVKTVIYTAHGFHFFKGAPLINRIIYYSMERLAAGYTDVLITINHEDYENARRFKLKKDGCVYLLPGVGIDVRRYGDTMCDKREKRKSLGIDENSFVVLSVGELNPNKNHEVVIRAMKKVAQTGITYLICGRGDYAEKLEALVSELKLDEKVRLLGFRTDIKEICEIADLFVFPSYREGLPVALMEAMSAGLPVLASNVRGNVDLVSDGVNGYLLNPSKEEEWERYIVQMQKDEKKRKEFSNNNKKKMLEYDKSEVKCKLETIYKKHFMKNGVSEWNA